MDRMIYVGMSGAKHTLEQQASVANNMANVSTPGFRAQLNNFRAVPVVGEEAATRAFVVASTPAADMASGPITETGRALDVAIDGDGWLALQVPGGEAYTRVGNLQVAADGQLTSMDRRPVLGEAGPMVVPPGAQVMISKDGLVSALAAGDPAAAAVGRLKLVRPAHADLVRGDDGLFRLRDGSAAAEADPGVTVTTGAIEGSNVNPVEAMVDMISNARRFELQMKVVQSADSNDQHANQLLSINS